MEEMKRSRNAKSEAGRAESVIRGIFQNMVFCSPIAGDTELGIDGTVFAVKRILCVLCGICVSKICGQTHS